MGERVNWNERGNEALRSGLELVACGVQVIGSQFAQLRVAVGVVNQGRKLCHGLSGVST